MSTISVTSINDGDAVTAASINNQINTIVNDYNGNITAANLATNAVTDAKITANNLLTTKFSNPYKFSVYRNAALNSPAGGAALVVFDTKLFDTGANYNTSTGFFAAPVAGFYYFNMMLVLASPTTRVIPTFYKNTTTEVSRGNDINGSTYGTGGGLFIQLAANDTMSVQIFTDAAKAFDVANFHTRFEGFLVSSI